MTDNREVMRTLLKAIVGKVPSSLNSASVQAVRDWKALIVKANKTLASNRATYEQLSRLHSELSQYK